MKDINEKSKALSSIINDITKGRLNFNLSVQRPKDIWNTREISLFVDSIIRNYPIYPALINKHSDSIILDVVDFKQRFTGIEKYYNGGFKLSKDLKSVEIDGVEYEIAGKKYNELDEAVRERFLNRNISMIIMEDATDDEIAEVFSRINMGHPLTNSHKRSALESSELRDYVATIAFNDFFNKVLSKAQFKKNVDKETTLQVLMLLMSDKYEFTSFKSKDMDNFVIYLNGILAGNDEGLKHEVTLLFDTLSSSLNALNEMLPEDINVKLNTLPLLIWAMVTIMKNNGDREQFISKAIDFLNGYGTNMDYLQYCSNATSNGTNVKARWEFWKNMI